MPAADHLRMHGENEHAPAQFGVEILKVSSPDGVHPSGICQALTNAPAARRILKKGKVIQVPGKGHFDQIDGFAEVVGRVNRRLDAVAAVIGSKVVAQQAAVIHKPVVNQQPERIGAETTGGRSVPPRCTAGQVLNESNAPFQDRPLFVAFQACGVLVAIAVVPDLMTFLDQALAFLRKRLDCVARNEPSRFDVVFRQEVKDTLGADLAELAAGQRKIGRASCRERV